MGKKVLVINAHPKAGSFCDVIMQQYAEAARKAGHQVQQVALRELDFDPILWNGYDKIQTLEPDLLAVQEWLQWCQHTVIIYPTWWGGAPAILKGFIDRVFLPGFSFKYREKGPWWDKLLKGRSARIITTMDTPYVFYRLVYKSSGLTMLKKNTLAFCGFKPVRTTVFGQVRHSNEHMRAKWLQKVTGLGQKAS